MWHALARRFGASGSGLLWYRSSSKIDIKALTAGSGPCMGLLALSGSGVFQADTAAKE